MRGLDGELERDERGRLMVHGSTILRPAEGPVADAYASLAARLVAGGMA